MKKRQLLLPFVLLSLCAFALMTVIYLYLGSFAVVAAYRGNVTTAVLLSAIALLCAFIIELVLWLFFKKSLSLSKIWLWSVPVMSFLLTLIYILIVFMQRS